MTHLQIVVCGAGPAADVTKLIAIAQERAWTSAVAATPSAMDFIDPQVIGEMTGHPVRSTYRSSAGTRRALPEVDALVIAPATYNTVNKIALGIADNYALTSIAELLGRGIPTVVVPFVNTALATRAPFQRAVEDLRHEHVRVLLGPEDNWEPHPPGTGNDQRQAFPWKPVFDMAEQDVQAHGSRRHDTASR